MGKEIDHLLNLEPFEQSPDSIDVFFELHSNEFFLLKAFCIVASDLSWISLKTVLVGCPRMGGVSHTVGALLWRARLHHFELCSTNFPIVPTNLMTSQVYWHLVGNIPSNSHKTI